VLEAWCKRQGGTRPDGSDGPPLLRKWQCQKRVKARVFLRAPGHKLSANICAKSLTSLGETNAIACASLMWAQKPMEAPAGVGGPSQTCRPLNRIARGFASAAMSHEAPTEAYPSPAETYPPSAETYPIRCSNTPISGQIGTVAGGEAAKLALSRGAILGAHGRRWRAHHGGNWRRVRAAFRRHRRVRAREVKQALQCGARRAQDLQ
jgi:hypothetical protein